MQTAAYSLQLVEAVPYNPSIMVQKTADVQPLAMSIVWAQVGQARRRYLSSLEEGLDVLYDHWVVGHKAGTEAQLSNGVCITILWLLNVANSQSLRARVH